MDDDDDNELSCSNTAFAGAVNNLGHLCEDIDKTINQKVQDNLNKLKDDCDECIKRIESLLADDKEARSQRRVRRCAGLLFSALAWCMPIILFIFAASAYKQTLPQFVADNDFVQTVFSTVEAQHMISPPTDAQGLGIWSAVMVGIFCISSFMNYRAAQFTTLDAKLGNRLRRGKKRARALLSVHHTLYEEYFKETVGSD